MSNSYVINADIRFKLNSASTKPVVDSLTRQLGSKGINLPVNLKFKSVKTQDITRQNTAFRQLTRTIAALGTSSSKSATQLNSLHRSISKVGRGLGSFGSAKGFQSFNKGIGQASNDIKSIGKNFSNANHQAIGFAESIGISARRFISFGAAAAVLAKVSYDIRNATVAALEFDHEMIKLKQVGDGTDKGISSIARTISKLGVNFGISSADMAKTSVTLRQAGLDGRETAKALEVLGKTTLSPSFEDLRSTTEGLIALFNQFDHSADNLKKHFSAISKVSADFAVESSDLVEALKRTGGAFQAAGGNVNELLAMFTTIRQSTRESAESIATGMRTIIARLQDPTIARSLKDIGVEVYDLKGQFIGPYQAVERLGEALRKLPSGDIRASQVLKDIGGLRQLSRVIPLIYKPEVTQDALKSANSGINKLDEDAKTAQQAIVVQISRIKEGFLDLFRVISTDGSVRTVLTSIASSIELISSALRGLKPLIPILLGFAAVKGIQATIGGLSSLRRGFFQPARGYAEGGFVSSGMGIPGKDSVPAMLMPGEYVVPAHQARSLRTGGSLLLGKQKHFAKGGYVTGGTPGKDSVDAKLMPGEYVLSKPVVDKIGKDNVERMAKGGTVIPRDKLAARDQFARALKANTPSDRKEIYNHIKDTKYLSKGAEAVVFQKPDQNVVRIGNSKTVRPKDDLTLQPRESKVVGDRLIEELPYAPPISETIKSPQRRYKVMSAFSSRLIKRGMADLDVHKNNLSVVNGKVKAIDPRVYSPASEVYGHTFSSTPSIDIKAYAQGGRVYSPVINQLLDDRHKIYNRTVRANFVKMLRSEHAPRIEQHYLKRNVEYVNSGKDAVVYKTSDDTALRFGSLGKKPERPRPKDNLTLQPILSRKLKNVHIEELPFVQDVYTQTGKDEGKTERLVNRFKRSVGAAGKYPTDVNGFNIGIHNKKLIAIDANTYSDEEPKIHRLAKGGIVTLPNGKYGKYTRTGKLYQLEDLIASQGREVPKGGLGQKTRLRRAAVDPKTGELTPHANFYAQYRTERFAKRLGIQHKAEGGKIEDLLSQVDWEPDRRDLTKVLRSEHGEAVASHIPSNAKYLASGSTAHIFQHSPEEVYRIENGKNFGINRPKDRYTLQAIESHQIGSEENGFLVEKLPYAPPISKTVHSLGRQQKIMNAFAKRLKVEGMEGIDIHSENIARHKGRIVAIDPETYRPRKPRGYATGGQVGDFNKAIKSLNAIKIPTTSSLNMKPHSFADGGLVEGYRGVGKDEIRELARIHREGGSYTSPNYGRVYFSINEKGGSHGDLRKDPKRTKINTTTAKDYALDYANSVEAAGYLMKMEVPEQNTIGSKYFGENSVPKMLRQYVKTISKTTLDEQGNQKVHRAFDKDKFITRYNKMFHNKKPKGFATGGTVGFSIQDIFKGQERGTDTVPAMLTPGEFVIPKEAAQAFGYDNLEKIRRKQFRINRRRESYSQPSLYDYNSVAEQLEHTQAAHSARRHRIEGDYRLGKSSNYARQNTISHKRHLRNIINEHRLHEAGIPVSPFSLKNTRDILAGRMKQPRSYIRMAAGGEATKTHIYMSEGGRVPGLLGKLKNIISGKNNEISVEQLQSVLDKAGVNIKASEHISGIKYQGRIRRGNQQLGGYFDPEKRELVMSRKAGIQHVLHEFFHAVDYKNDQYQSEQKGTKNYNIAKQYQKLENTKNKSLIGEEGLKKYPKSDYNIESYANAAAAAVLKKALPEEQLQKISPELYERSKAGEFRGLFQSVNNQIKSITPTTQTSSPPNKPPRKPPAPPASPASPGPRPDRDYYRRKPTQFVDKTGMSTHFPGESFTNIPHVEEKNIAAEPPFHRYNPMNDPNHVYSDNMLPAKSSIPTIQSKSPAQSGIIVTEGNSRGKIVSQPDVKEIQEIQARQQSKLRESVRPNRKPMVHQGAFQQRLKTPSPRPSMQRPQEFIPTLDQQGLPIIGQSQAPTFQGRVHGNVPIIHAAPASQLPTITAAPNTTNLINATQTVVPGSPVINPPPLRPQPASYPPRNMQPPGRPPYNFPPLHVHQDHPQDYVSPQMRERLHSAYFEPGYATHNFYSREHGNISYNGHFTEEGAKLYNFASEENLEQQARKNARSRERGRQQQNAARQAEYGNVTFDTNNLKASNKRTFKYSYRDDQNRVVRGKIEAERVDQARQMLAQKGIKPFKISRNLLSDIMSASQRIDEVDKATTNKFFPSFQRWVRKLRKSTKDTQQSVEGFHVPEGGAGAGGAHDRMEEHRFQRNLGKSALLFSAGLMIPQATEAFFGSPGQAGYFNTGGRGSRFGNVVGGGLAGAAATTSAVLASPFGANPYALGGAAIVGGTIGAFSSNSQYGRALTDKNIQDMEERISKVNYNPRSGGFATEADEENFASGIKKLVPFTEAQAIRGRNTGYFGAVSESFRDGGVGAAIPTIFGMGSVNPEKGQALVEGLDEDRKKALSDRTLDLYRQVKKGNPSLSHEKVLEEVNKGFKGTGITASNALLALPENFKSALAFGKTIDDANNKQKMFAELLAQSNQALGVTVTEIEKFSQSLQIGGEEFAKRTHYTEQAGAPLQGHIMASPNDINIGSLGGPNSLPGKLHAFSKAGGGYDQARQQVIDLLQNEGLKKIVALKPGESDENDTRIATEIGSKFKESRAGGSYNKEIAEHIQGTLGSIQDLPEKIRNNPGAVADQLLEKYRPLKEGGDVANKQLQDAYRIEQERQVNLENRRFALNQQKAEHSINVGEFNAQQAANFQLQNPNPSVRSNVVGLRVRRSDRDNGRSNVLLRNLQGQFRNPRPIATPEQFIRNQQQLGANLNEKQLKDLYNKRLRRFNKDTAGNTMSSTIRRFGQRSNAVAITEQRVMSPEERAFEASATERTKAFQNARDQFQGGNLSVKELTTAYGKQENRLTSLQSQRNQVSRGPRLEDVKAIDDQIKIANEDREKRIKAGIHVPLKDERVEALNKQMDNLYKDSGGAAKLRDLDKQIIATQATMRDYNQQLKLLADNTSSLEDAQKRYSMAQDRVTSDLEARKKDADTLAFGSRGEKMELAQRENITQQALSLNAQDFSTLPDQIKKIVYERLQETQGMNRQVQTYDRFGRERGVLNVRSEDALDQIRRPYLQALTNDPASRTLQNDRDRARVQVQREADQKFGANNAQLGLQEKNIGKQEVMGEDSYQKFLQGINKSIAQQMEASNKFLAQSAELTQALNNFNGKLSIERSGKIEIVLNGAQVLNKLKGDLETEILEQVIGTLKDEIAKQVNKQPLR